MSDKWAEYKKQFCGCKDASRKNSCKGLPNCCFPLGHPERKAATDGYKQLIDQVTKAQQEMAKWPKSWRDGLNLVLDIFRSKP